MLEEKEPVLKAIQVIDKTINESLAKENITEKLIESYKKEYLGLKVESLEDKEIYNKITNGRKEIKRVRILAKNIFEAGRSPYEEKVKEWKSKEKDIVSKFQDIESELQIEEDKFEKWKEEEKQKLAEEKKKFLQDRVDQLIAVGVQNINIQNIENLSDFAFEMQLNTAKEAFELKAQQQLLSEKRINEVIEQDLTIDPSIDYGVISEEEFQEHLFDARKEKTRKEEELKQIQKELTDERDRQKKADEARAKEEEILKQQQEALTKERESFMDERLATRIVRLEKELKCTYFPIGEDNPDIRISVTKTKTEDAVSVFIGDIRPMTNEEFEEEIEKIKQDVKICIEFRKSSKAEEEKSNKQAQEQKANREIDRGVFDALRENALVPALELVSKCETKSLLGEDTLEEVHVLIGKAVLLLESFNKQ